MHKGCVVAVDPGAQTIHDIAMITLILPAAGQYAVHLRPFNPLPSRCYRVCPVVFLVFLVCLRFLTLICALDTALILHVPPFVSFPLVDKRYPCSLSRVVPGASAHLEHILLKRLWPAARERATEVNS